MCLRVSSAESCPFCNIVCSFVCLIQKKFVMSVPLDENPWFVGSMEREKAEQFLMEVSHFHFDSFKTYLII